MRKTTEQILREIITLHEERDKLNEEMIEDMKRIIEGKNRVIAIQENILKLTK